VKVHTNPDVKVLWNLKDGFDLSKDICSCIIDCEVVDMWPQRFEELKAFIDENERLPSVKEKKEQTLCNWKNTQQTSFTAIKRNRTSATTSQSAILINPTVTVTGTEIDAEIIAGGSGKKSGKYSTNKDAEAVKAEVKTPKDEKLQVLLSSEDHHKLKRIILQYSMVNGKLMTASSYVRELIKNHIKEYEGEQSSFVNDKVRDVIRQTKLEDSIYPEFLEKNKKS
jgi:hypothetical protein